MIIFIIYIFCVLIGGTIYVGPLSIRVVATCLMTLYLIVTAKRQSNAKVIDHSYIWIYLIFSVLMGVALVINGEFEKYQFIKKFLAYNFVSIIAFFAIDRFVSSYERMRQFIVCLLLLIVFDDIVTILQYLGNPIGWAIGYVFSDIDKFANSAEDKSSLLGMSLTPGILGHVVNNAFYIAMVTPLCFALIGNKTKLFKLFFVGGVFVLSAVAVYMTQQRAAFYVLLISLFLLSCMILKKHPLIILSILVICLIIPVFFMDVSVNIDYGRLTQTSNTGRLHLTYEAIAFIGSHPMFGGPVSFLNKTGLPAHNIVLDSYINAGLMGFIVMMLLFAKTSFKSAKRIFVGFKVKKNNFTILFTAYALFGCMFYSLTHNTSFLSGEVMVFILLALTLKTENLSLANRA